VSIKGISFALPALRAWPGQLSIVLLNASLTMPRSNPAQDTYMAYIISKITYVEKWLGVSCNHACRSYDLAVLRLDCNANLGSMDYKKAKSAHFHDNITDLSVCHSVAQVNTTPLQQSLSSNLLAKI